MPLEVGDRVEVERERATVAYVGAVEGFVGTWVGLDWDDPHRGKHDGTVKGRRYFQTRHPTSGSLMKEALLKSAGGSDLLTAIISRYDDRPIFGENHQLQNSKKTIELVGMEKISKKQSNVHALKNVVLTYERVSHVLPSDTEPFVRCTELNMVNNLLSSWDEVHRILKLFPHLVEFVLTKNKMRQLDEPKCFNGISPTLNCIVVNETGLTEISLRHLLDTMLTIALFYATGIELRRFSPSPSAAARLVQVNLEQNEIDSFGCLCGQFPNLERLNLRSCKITSVGPNEEFPKRFPKLAYLNLKDNQLCDWQSINNLAELPSLSSFAVDESNFSCEKDISVFEVMIAKLPRLSDLNRFDANVVERRSAEIRFLTKYFALDDERRLCHQQDIDRLVKLHGAPVVAPIKQALSVISLSIVHGDTVKTKNLPLNLTVQKLTEMLARLFSLNARSVSLTLVREGQIVELDNPLRTLHHFDPEPTDRLVIR